MAEKKTLSSLHDFTLFEINIHQNMPISLFPTLFDHFTFSRLWQRNVSLIWDFVVRMNHYRYIYSCVSLNCIGLWRKNSQQLMFGQNWNGVVNEGNPAVYLGLKSWVGHISDTTSASSYPLEPLIAWDRDWIVKYKTFFWKFIMVIAIMMMMTIMTMMMISATSEMISFGRRRIPGGPRDLTEHLYLLFTHHLHHHHQHL